LRNLYLRDAEGLAARFRELSGQLSNIEQDTQAEINLKLTSLNELGKQLFTVNQQLAKKATLNGQPPNLLDKRDGILRDMAEIAKIHVTHSDSGTVEVRLDSQNGTPVVDSLRSTVFSATFDATQPGQVEVLANVYGAASPTNS
jgi:flagellar hook-associated protein FlgK